MGGGQDARRRAAVHAALSLGAAGLLCVLVVSSFTRPFFPFDCWSYHLPFASRLFGVGGGAEAFILAPALQRVFDGYPLLGDWLQGAIWRFTGSLRFVTAVNSLSLAGLIAYASITLRLPLAPLTFGALAFPLVPIHATSGMNDLLVGTALCAQVVAGVRLIELAREREGRPGWKRWSLHAALFVSTAAVAGLSKFTGIALAWTASAVVVGQAFSRSVLPSFRRAIVVVTLLASLAAGGVFWRNLLRHGNAFYPTPARRMVVDKLPSLPVNEIQGGRSYTRRFGFFQRPVEFVLSISEIDWLVRGVDPLYNIDSNNGDTPRRFQGIRTGGLWGPYVVAQLVLFGVAARRRRRRTWEVRERQLAWSFAALSLVIAWLPLSYMLRYWLVWPLLLAVCTTAFHASRRDSRHPLLLTVGLALACGWSFLALPTRASLRILPIQRYDQEAMRARLAPELLRAIDAGESFCLDASHFPRQFRYSRALVGGRHTIEQVAQGPCTRLPRLDLAAPALRPPP